MAILQAQHLTVSYLRDGRHTALAIDDVSVTLDEGQVLAILGPSGSGKSTLLRAIAGLEVLDSGRVLWQGDDITALPVHKRGFALMFQDGQLFAHRTVAANVAYALQIARMPVPEQRVRVAELLHLVGLDGFGDRRVTELSGGEQQRVALARSLAARPRLLLLDEPLSSLDRELRERLGRDLRRILIETGTTAIFVTHDQGEAVLVADRIGVMMDTHLVQEGPASEVLDSPATEEVARFLGR
ncbi:MAG: ABC transporter ATP-binding protein [Actinobacteria bacterium]|nr:ABC transporter ATP-binding protein [Actinomycetota bacterium]